MTSENLTAQAQSGGFWKSEDGPINFCKAFSADYPGISLSEKQMPDNRLQCATRSLEAASNEGSQLFKDTVLHLFYLYRLIQKN